MRSTSFSRVFVAPARATSSPATIVGFFAAMIRFDIASTPAGSGRLALKMRAGLPAGTVVSCSITLIGSATNTGPAGASLAILKARCRTGPSSSARSTCTLHLVTGAAIAARSWPSTGSRSRMRVSCWPAVTTMGELFLSAL